MIVTLLRSLVIKNKERRRSRQAGDPALFVRMGSSGVAGQTFESGGSGGSRDLMKDEDLLRTTTEKKTESEAEAMRPTVMAATTEVEMHRIDSGVGAGLEGKTHAEEP